MYTLLTGATGFLGRYLMRDLLLRGRNVAVLVRPKRRDSAMERVENVLSYWERSWKRTLPRPIVLAGDIIQPSLGLSKDDRRWVRENCQAMLHSAASMIFHEEDGEPWRSNVQGMRHVLDVCDTLQIGKLYTVSTAYTCGLRTGTIFEDELDVGQEFGNDYERSKVQAEKLVRQASFLDVAAIFRPASIVGDSQTGLATNFHGFYTPLRLACALLTQLSHEQVFELDYMSMMGLAGGEGYNMVPVDWVSQAIVSVIERYPEVSQTYALTSPRPVTSDQIRDVIQAVTRTHCPDRAAANASPSISLESAESNPIVAAYLEQLQTYESHWRDDPVFDCSHTTAALPDLPCPILTDDVLFRIAEWAVESKFTIPLGARGKGTLVQWLQPDRSQRWAPRDDRQEAPRVITIAGQGGGSWTIQTDELGSTRICDGRLDGAPELCLGSKVFERIIKGETTLTDAAEAGDLMTSGRACDLDSWHGRLFAAQSSATERA